MDSNADAQAPDMLEKQETASESNGSRREMLVIAWLIALFVSNISGSTSSSMTNFIFSGSCLHFLVEALGEERITLASIGFAMIISSYKTYLEGDVVIFFLYISIITLGGGIFLLTVMRRFRAARQDSIGTRAFTMATLILRQLLDNGIIPTDAGLSTSSLHDLHEVLFEASFILSIMSLWLQSIGIRLLNPIHRTPDVRCDGASVVAFILYWSGAAFLVGYAVITMIISSPGTPVFAKLACMVYGAHTMIALFG